MHALATLPTWTRLSATAWPGLPRTGASTSTGSTHAPGATLDTCFAFLFLKRAGRGALLFPSFSEPVQRVAAKQGRSR
ncbi:MAG: hypothetical protein AB7T63_13560 [Planctomycetota bacterium]